MDERYIYHKGAKGTAKRKNARVTLFIPATYQLGDGNIVKTNITVLSSGGVSFQAKSVLLPGEKIDFSFKLQNHLYHFKGEVTRSMGNEYGCRFLDISDDQRDTLNMYITKNLFSPSKNKTQ